MELREIRTKRGLTQEQLAYMVGVTVRAVQKWESNGVDKAQFAVMSKVAEVLGVPMEDLLD